MTAPAVTLAEIRCSYCERDGLPSLIRVDEWPRSDGADRVVSHGTCAAHCIAEFGMCPDCYEGLDECICSMGERQSPPEVPAGDGATVAGRVVARLSPGLEGM